MLYLMGLHQFAEMNAGIMNPLQRLVLGYGRRVKLLSLAKIQLAKGLELGLPLRILEPLLPWISLMRACARS